MILVALSFVWVTQRSFDDSSALEITPNSAPSASDASAGAGPGESAPDTTAPIDYRVGLLGSPSTDNFWAYYGREATVWNAYVLGATKPALYGLEPGSNELTADLASSKAAEPEQDGDEWEVTVVLGDEALWSDGRPITSGDFLFTFETVRELGLQGGWETAYPDNLHAVEVSDAKTLTLVFRDRPVLAEWPYGVGLAPVMPSHVWQPIVNDADTPQALYDASGADDVSGGPLSVVNWKKGSIRAVAHRTDGTSLSTVVFWIYANEASAVSAMIAAEIDTVLSPGGLTPDGVSVLEGVDDIAIETSPANSIRYLGFNLHREPMSDQAFRMALALLFDRAAAVSDVVPGAEPAYSLIPPANEAWYDETTWRSLAAPFNRNLNQRLQKALKGLRDTGYTWVERPKVVKGSLTAGTGLEIHGVAPAPLTILTSGDKHDPARPEYAHRLESTLEVLGFDVRPVETDFDTVVDLAFTPPDEGPRTYDMYLLGWTLGNPALPDFYEEFFVENGAINSTGYSREGFDDAWASYRGASTHSEAVEALWEMEEMLADDLPYLPLYHPIVTEAYRSDRVEFGLSEVLGGLHSRIGGIGDLSPAQ